MEDAPLYVFDGDILMRLRSLQSEYIIPEYFWQDLFVLLGKHLRPSYRWYACEAKPHRTTNRSD